MKNESGAATPRQIQMNNNNDSDGSTVRQVSRELLDKHLCLIAEAEESGKPYIAEAAHELWARHEIGLTVLQAMLWDANAETMAVAS